MTRRDFTCVWLDNQLLRSEEYRDSQDEMRKLFENFNEFSKSQQCLEFITNFSDGQILLITSSNLAKNLLPKIHSDKRIASIYLFSSSKSADEQWTKDYSKIRGIVSDIRLIPSQIQRERTAEPIAMSFVSSTDIISPGENRQDPSFMYFQLLKEVLTHNYLLELDEPGKQEMLAYCREVNIHNPTAIVILDEFEKHFIPELAIYWYTRECFLHQMLNQALWKIEIDVLYRLRYFLRHLHKQIVAEAKKQRASLSKMIVYRGQSITEDQIEKIKNNIGGFLSFNNFLSTSLRKDIALNFLFGAKIGVLFEMHIDPSVQDIPIVNIERIPYLQVEFSEHELLFSMGSVFRIVEIAQENDYYRVKLTLSENMDEQLAAYTSVTRQQVGFTHCFLSLLNLMNQLSEYTYLDRFAEILRNDTALNSNMFVSASIYQTFGLIYFNREQLKQSLEHSQKAMELYSTYLPANHQNLTPVYNNIGCVYLAQSNYEKALEYQQLALDCQTSSNQPDLSSIIVYTNNVAKIYSQQEKYNEALTYHKRALELQQQFYGENDPSIAETYGYLSSVYRNLGDLVQASKF